MVMMKTKKGKNKRKKKQSALDSGKKKCYVIKANLNVSLVLLSVPF